MIRYTCSEKMEESMRNLHLVLFIGVMCVVHTISGMCPYNDPRCSCSGTSLTCYGLLQIPPLNTAMNDSEVTSILFEGGNINSLSNNKLPPGLKTIAVIFHPLASISDDAFDSIAATLETVDIAEANLNSLPTALKKLTKLTHLSFQNVRIQVWDNATLKQIGITLEQLSLRNVSLSDWPSWISDFHLLSTLDLSSNSLKSIPDDAFTSIKYSLTKLYLSQTALTRIPQALSILTNLVSLDLKNNNFSNVSEFDMITAAPFAGHLSVLYLDSTGLTRTTDFSNLTRLSTLGLSRNRISEIPPGSLPKSLTILDLIENSLSSVPKDVADMSLLRNLYLYDNLITNIEANSFPPSLATLELSYNKLTIITDRAFRNLKLLDTLHLNFNPISTISPEAFAALVSLRDLSIRSSFLTEIPLAFTLLSTNTDLSWTTSQPLSCLCPASSKLVKWFNLFGNSGHIEVSCSNGQSLKSYLGGECGGQVSVTP